MTTRTGPTGRRFARRLAAAVCVAAIGVGGLTMADAATLTVNGGGVSTVAAGPCAEQLTVTTANGVLLWYSQVRVTVPAACADRSFSLVVDTGASSPPRVDRPAGLAAGTHTLTLPSTLWIWETDFRVVVDGWAVDA